MFPGTKLAKMLNWEPESQASCFCLENSDRNVCLQIREINHQVSLLLASGLYPSKLQAGVQCDERHNFRFFKILLKCLKYFNKLNVTARIKIGQRVNQNRFTYLDRELDN